MNALQVSLLYPILNSIKDPLILMNKDRMVEWTNDVHARVWGRPPETFRWRGRQWSPRAFLIEALRLDMDAYRAAAAASDMVAG